MVTESETRTCSHYWVLPENGGVACCRECGRRREFPRAQQQPEDHSAEVTLLSLEALDELDVPRSRDWAWLSRAL